MDEQKKTLKVEGYGRDPELVRNGVAVPVGENPDKSIRYIVVRPLNSDSYERSLEARTKQYSPGMLKANPALHRELQKDAAVGTAFVAVKNFYEEGSFEEVAPVGSGEFSLRAGVDEIPSTRENLRALLDDRVIFGQFVEAAASEELFRQARSEEISGNSHRSSSGA